MGFEAAAAAALSNRKERDRGEKRREENGNS